MQTLKSLLFVSLVAAAVFLSSPGLAVQDSALAQLAAAWQEAYNADDLDAVADLYAEDASRMPPNQETIGKSGIVANLQAFKDAGGAKTTIEVIEEQAIGDLGYGRGTYEVTGADGSHIDHGKWLVVVKRINGEWKLYKDMFNSDMALPTP